MTKIHLITFANEKFYKAAEILIAEAKSVNVFHSITLYTDKDLKEDHFFWSNCGEFIEKNRRGYGYWCWKSYVIFKKLKELDDGEILVYADAGCKINANQIAEFRNYIKLLIVDGYDNLVRVLPSFEMAYTKKDIFDFFRYTNYYSKQIQAGIQFIKKNNKTMQFFTNLVYTTINNIHLLTDEISSNESERFIENRHDQSIFSIMLKMSNLKYGNINTSPSNFIYAMRRRS